VPPEWQFRSQGDKLGFSRDIVWNATWAASASSAWLALGGCCAIRLRGRVSQVFICLAATEDIEAVQKGRLF
jgi:hypothetical protein